MTGKTIHVAAENAAFRESLRATVASFGIGDIVVASPEGREGILAVRETRPDILVVSTGVDEDTAEHLQWYRDAAPQAHIVGFAFTEREGEDLRALGIETVVSTKSPRSEVIEVLKHIDRHASKSV